MHSLQRCPIFPDFPRAALFTNGAVISLGCFPVRAWVQCHPAHLAANIAQLQANRDYNSGCFQANMIYAMTVFFLLL
jgi:hypothetical protein